MASERKQEEAEERVSEQTDGESAEASQGGEQLADAKSSSYLFYAALGVVALLIVILIIAGSRDDRKPTKIGIDAVPEYAVPRHEGNGPGAGFGRSSEGKPAGGDRSSFNQGLAERLGVEEKELEKALRDHREGLEKAREEFAERVRELERDLADRLGVSEKALERSFPWAGRGPAGERRARGAFPPRGADAPRSYTPGS